MDHGHEPDFLVRRINDLALVCRDLSTLLPKIAKLLGADLSSYAGVRVSAATSGPLLFEV